jgi:hypothetical protein
MGKWVRNVVMGAGLKGKIWRRGKRTEDEKRVKGY